MKNYDFAGMGITLDNVKDFETEFSEYKKSLRATAKDAAANKKADAAAEANAKIEDGSIVKGAAVVVLYNRNEVTGIIKNTPNVDAKNLPVESDSFANKDHFLYVPKTSFVRMA